MLTSTLRSLHFIILMSDNGGLASFSFMCWQTTVQQSIYISNAHWSVWSKGRLFISGDFSARWEAQAWRWGEEREESCDHTIKMGTWECNSRWQLLTHAFPLPMLISLPPACYGVNVSYTLNMFAEGIKRFLRTDKLIIVQAVSDICTNPPPTESRGCSCFWHLRADLWFLKSMGSRSRLAVDHAPGGWSVHDPNRPTQQLL